MQVPKEQSAVASRETKTAITAAAILKMKEDERRRSGARQPGEGSLMRVIFGIFPLLLIPVVLYNLIALGQGAPEPAMGSTTALAAPMANLLAERFIGLPMISGVEWVLTKGDAIVLLAVTLLFFEILKSTSTGTATIINHGVSLLIFIICLVQFLLMPNFATSTFFLLTAMSLLDVLAGVIVTIVSARRDFGVDQNV